MLCQEPIIANHAVQRMLYSPRLAWLHSVLLLVWQISRDQAQLLQQHQDMVAKWQKANNKKLQELMLLGETVPDEVG